VEFPRGFAIARTEITNAQYEAFRPDHERDSRSSGDRDPVVNVSWDDAKAYCAWLAEKSGRPVRLPSESEWEAACRAGGSGEYTFGDDEAGLAEYAWYGGNWSSGAHEVATKKANAWGIHDLHGNVWEWCEDLYHDSYVVMGPVVQPDGKTMQEVVSRAPTDGIAWLHEGGSSGRVYRGGHRGNLPRRCRSAIRGWSDPGYRRDYLGFRPAMGD
jgi:formylglycine-generating enzyme required for sulfatase activity